MALKIRYFSDLHLEFGEPETIRAHGDEDAVIFAGDGANNPSLSIQWFAKTFPNTRKIFIPGNHEYYRGHVQSRDSYMRVACRLAGIDLLGPGNKSVNLSDDVWVIGATLWTDFWASRGFETFLESMRIATNYMNDYRTITFGDSASMIAPEDVLSLHRNHLSHINSQYDSILKGNSRAKIILVTHHGVSEKSCAPEFADAGVGNSYFFSDLDSFIIERPAIKHVIHGHTHRTFEYKLSDAADQLVHVNPRGYCPRGRDPENPSFNPDAFLVI